MAGRYLIIRNVQMDALAKVVEEDFAARAVEHVRATQPAAYLDRGHEAIVALVDTALEKSRTYRIERETDALEFIRLLLALGVDFETRDDCDWTRDILSDPNQSAELRLARISLALPS